MNRNIKAAVLAVVVGLSTSNSANSQAVYCTNCSTTVTQLLDSANLAQMLLTQAEDLANSYAMYANMIKNTGTLPTQIFGDAMAEINQIKSIMDTANGIAYTASDLSAKFSQRYKGADAYKSLGIDSEDISAKFDQWSSDTNEAALNTLKVMKAQSDGFTDEDALLQQIQSHAQSADGQMQAISVGNELAIQNVAQLQKLRQLLMTQSAMQAQIIQRDQDREDVARAHWETFNKSSGTGYTGKTY